MSEQELVDIIKKEVEKYLSGNKSDENSKEKINFYGTDLILKQELEKKFIIEESANRVIVSEINIKNFVDLSLGTYSDEVGEKLLTYILSGKEIFIVEEGIEYRNYTDIPKKLLKKYEFYEKEILDYGIKIIKRVEVLENLKEKNRYFSGKLLDLKTLRKNYDENKKIIELSKETTITDLAKEFAETNGIKIIKR
ncbi:hypothetical protein H3N56_01020 [Cetobacterium sp. 2A]|uniref:hypothetical protein n=1 Tax=Cetobacterium sp. 2A TaxID=2754723 RepID=UPI00163CC8A1|nr:hypothetical protein [Cetobacterium sp. 2A]MBC2855074.1 hypothetical protein [Cetobacterium sp. 2A]